MATSMSRPRKREVDALRVEAAALTQQLAWLRSAHVRPAANVASAVIDNALLARRKRKRAEDENHELRMALRQQSRFVRQLRTFLDAGPLRAVVPDSDWCSYLHNYTRLPRDVGVRRTEFSHLTSDRRLRLAMETLVADTHGMPFTEPTIRSQCTLRPDGLRATTVGVYALATTDVSAALRGACVAIRDIAGVWPECSLAGLSRDVVDTNASSACSLQYSIDTARFRDAADHELVVATRVATCYTMLDGCGVVFWDFVDDDELFPLSDDADIIRCSIGGCLVRLETCDDGVERVVCRTVCSKRYVRRHTSQTSHHSERFLSHFEHTTRPNSIVFKEIVMQQVAEEDMLLAIAESAC